MERKNMGKTVIMILFTMTLLLLSNGIAVKAEDRRTLLTVDRKLKLLNKPAVKSIKSEDGDIVDCVDIHKQPAFDHPALRNHIIQMRPTSNLAFETSSTKNESSLVLSQTWTRSGSCPEGTIPIRRIQRQDLLRADSLEHFGRDGPRTSSTASTTTVKRKLKKWDTIPANHSAVYLHVNDQASSGAKADINIWSPVIETVEEYSTGQIWLKSQHAEVFKSFEAGWVVYPKLYGNDQPRLFIRWTLDGYQKTGCFDLICSGFVQVNKKHLLGGTITPVSQIGANLQRIITISIAYEPVSNGWWLSVGDDKVGYWPNELINNDRNSMAHFFWGGDVYSQNVLRSPHTSTAMGSGQFANRRFGNACYIANPLLWQTNRWETLDPDPYITEIYSYETSCYSISQYDAFDLKPPTFYFGGPGRNEFCP